MENRRFTEIDEEFICENCGKKVSKLGYSCRDHCPYCLHSKHVDKNPGDRQETCHGDLEPVSLEIDGKKGYVISEDDDDRLTAIKIKNNKTYYFDMPEQLAFLKKELTGTGLILLGEK